MAIKPGGTPFGDEISEATCNPAKDHQELDQIGRSFMRNLVKLIVSVIVSSARVRSQIFNAIIGDPRFGDIVTERARTGLAEELRVRNIVVHEVDMTNIRFETVYGHRKEAAGSSRIAIFVGAVLGLLAGILAMTVINATPVAVNVARQTASIGVSSAVDQLWFITIVLVITTLIGAALGGLKKRYEMVPYPKGMRAVYTGSEES